MQVDPNRVYRVKAVAEMLDVSPATIYRAIESGQLDAYKMGTGKGTLRVPGSAIELYLDECGEAAYRAYVEGKESPEADDRDELAAGTAAAGVVS